jgi:uncharacterized protein YjiS (DUF1127 family)
MHLASLEHLKPLLYRLINRLNLYARRIRTRRQLFDLEDYVLRDLGLTRQQALEEARRYFWQGEDGHPGDDTVPQKTDHPIVKPAYPAGEVNH